MKKISSIFRTLGVHIFLGVISFSSIGIIYAAWNDDVSSGDSLTADSWNALVTQVEGITAGAGKFISGTDTNDAVFTGGNVGIGVSDPTRELDIEGTARFGSNIYIGENTIQAYVNARVISEDNTLKLGASRSSNGDGVYIGAETDTTVNFLQNNTSAMVIDENQYVGIGTSSPNSTLDVNGISRLGSANHLQVSFEQKEISNPYAYNDYMWGSTRSGYFMWHPDFLRIEAESANAIALTGGNVGIGTISPSNDAILDINSSTQGVKMPRVALVSHSSPSPLSTHTVGMIVYNTNPTYPLITGLYINDGTKWVSMVNSGSKVFGDMAVNIGLSSPITTNGEVEFDFSAWSGSMPGVTINSDGTMTLLKGTYTMEYLIDYSQLDSFVQAYAAIFEVESGSMQANPLGGAFFHTTGDRDHQQLNRTFYVSDSVTFRLKSAYVWGVGSNAGGSARLARVALD